MFDKESYSEAVKAFAKAQGEMGAAIKNAKNPFLKNTYADLNAVQAAVYPAFHANGFAITQTCGADEMGKFVETLAIHSTGNSFGSKVYIEYKPGDMQSLGGAITYARRYGLTSLTGIPVEDDDGNAATGRGAPQAKAPQQAPRAEDQLMQRADKMLKFVAAATAEQMIKMGQEANSLIEDVAAVNKEKAEELRSAWDKREQEIMSQ